MRTPSCTLKRRAGIVSLSMNESDPEANSASTPNLNAARIPSFTHAATCQMPSASRVAARIEPFSSSARKSPIVFTASVRSVIVLRVRTRTSIDMNWPVVIV